MNVLYHLTILPPEMPECVAEVQEINALRNHFGGDLIYLNPNQHSPIYLPRLLFGFHKLTELRKQEVDLDLHHVYNPDPFAFPMLRHLKRPVIYSISGGVGNRRPNIRFFNSLAAVVVPDERSWKRLKVWGLDKVFCVRAGINTAQFTFSPLPLQSEINLMVGSAPWTRTQFRTKGIDALLSAAQRYSQLRLIFLWRGVLADEMKRRVRQMNLTEQVTVLDKQVDVNKVLADVHASITLASAPGIVKSYPHSLLESLAAGKPVLVSRAIPMADYVQETGCGKVVESVTPTEVLSTIESLARKYEDLQESAQRVGQRDFSQDGMVASFRKVYAHVLEQASQR
jgi:glycosyltransferase involved in cell wall biosynthesis